MNDEQIEQEIQNKGLTAPRVTTADIEAAIDRAWYFTAADGVVGDAYGQDVNKNTILRPESPLHCLTFCVLVMNNGFTVTGESKPVVLSNFDAEFGRKIARQNAIDKCWPLFGFALANDIANGKATVSVV